MHKRLQGAFDKIRAEEELKNCTREYLIHKTKGYGKKSPVFNGKLAGALVCFALLFFGAGYYVCLTPSFVISVDVNPSVELGVSRFDRVVSVETFNEEGEALMAGADVLYLEYEKALEKILTDGNMEQYTAQGQLVSVTVFGEDEKQGEEMLGQVSACMASHSSVYCSMGNSAEVSKAHALGLSCGKYQAFLELQALDPDITVEEVQGMTMCQIQDRINALSGNEGGAGQTGCQGRKSGGGCHHERGHCQRGSQN